MDSCFIFVTSACSSPFLDEGLLDAAQEDKAITSLTKSVENPFFVTENDLRDYVRFKSLSEKEDLAVLDIVPYGDAEDFCFYVINYDGGGWDLIAADKRYDPLIANNPNGYFSEDDLIPPIKEWLDTFEEELKIFKTIPDLKAFSGDDYDRAISNVKYWSMVTGEMPSLENGVLPTKSQFDPSGYWEIISITTDTLQYQLVNHLIQTHWHQDAPYNAYCPFKSYSSSLRAPAGCVAIAGAQVAYFLHNKIGLPQTAPLTAFCDAQVPTPGYNIQYPYIPTTNDPNMNVSNLNSSAWPMMSGNSDYIAKLITQVGIDVSMNYYNDLSLSTIALLPDYYFMPNGISCSSYTPINTSTYSSIYSNILSGYPVIARASASDESGHAFIIDGYRYRLVRITTTYAWVPLDPANANYYDNRVETVDRSYTHVTMNWGWGNNYPFDNGWYVLSENWQVNNVMFTSNKYMIYNFGVL